MKIQCQINAPCYISIKNMQKPPMNKTISPKIHSNANEIPIFMKSKKGIVNIQAKGLVKSNIQFIRRERELHFMQINYGICARMNEIVFNMNTWHRRKCHREQEVHRNERKITEKESMCVFLFIHCSAIRCNKETRSNKSHINIFQKQRNHFPKLDLSSPLTALYFALFAFFRKLLTCIFLHNAYGFFTYTFSTACKYYANHFLLTILHIFAHNTSISIDHVVQKTKLHIGIQPIIFID